MQSQAIKRMSSSKKQCATPLSDIASTALILPTISPDIPDHYKLKTNYDVAASFAEILSYHKDLSHIKKFDFLIFKKIWEEFFNQYDSEAFEKVFRKCVITFMNLEEMDDNLGLSDDCWYETHDPYGIHIESCINGPERYEILDLLDSWEKENPGLGKLILELLTGCPFYILTPFNLRVSVSDLYWQGFDDDLDVISEFHEMEYDDEQIESQIVTSTQLTSAFPAWMFTFNGENEYKGWIPENVKKLQECQLNYRQVRDNRKHIEIVPMRYELSGVALSYKEGSDSLDIIDRVQNEINDWAMSTSYGPNVSSHCLLLNVSKPEKCVTSLFEELDAVFRYAAAAAELLVDLEKQANIRSKNES